MRIEDMLVRDIKYDKRPRGRNKPDLQQMRVERARAQPTLKKGGLNIK